MNWAKLFRRSGGLLCGIVGLGLLVVSSTPGGVDRLASLSGSALALEQPEKKVTKLNFLEKLVVKQSPFLSSGLLLSDLPASTPVSPSPSPTLPPEPTPVTPTSTPGSSGVDPGISAEEDTLLPPYSPTSPTIIAQTIRPSNYGSLPSADGVYLQNRTSQTVDMQGLAATPITLSGSKNGPSILILHTHSTESYTQTPEDVYEESDSYRTTDPAHNIIRVGDEMAAAFARAGLNVLHDRNLYDYPNYNGAYSRSKAVIEQYLELYPSISVVLDVHRDALMAEDGSIYKVVTEAETAEDCAQIMLVVGTEEAGGSHPNWAQNLSFAIGLQRNLNEKAPSLARPITLRKSHYNQQLSPGSLLVEVGTHGNTLEEAIRAAQLFAETTAPYIASLLPE